MKSGLPAMIFEAYQQDFRESIDQVEEIESKEGTCAGVV